MKKFKATLSTNSIDKVIAQLEKVKAQLQSGNPMRDLLYGCCEKIIEIANRNIAGYDIGVNVMNEIIGSWEYKSSFDGNKIVLRNNTAKAVFVEFGVGIVGQQNPHENATQAGYEYNKASTAKTQANAQGFEYGTWIFYQNAKDLDLPATALDDRVIFNEPERNSERMLIRTKGTPATMFVFKAVQEFKALNYAQDIWKQVVKKYWG